MDWTSKTILSLTVLFSLSGNACRLIDSKDSATITIDPNITYQEIYGWEATAEGGEDEEPGRAVFHLYNDKLFEAAIDLGINRLRVGIPSGIENSVDWYGQYLRGEVTRDEWRKHRYQLLNDNDDPFDINLDGFNWSRLDSKMEHIVLPLKQRLEARGEKLFLNFNYTAFSYADSFHRENPEEYAEFTLATYQYMNSKYGFVPDAWEVILEPDNTAWTGTDIGRAIAATGKRLKENGFTPRFIAPSTTNMAKAITYFDEMVKIEGVLPFLAEFSYHRYGGVSEENLQAIANRGMQYGVATSMLEWIGATHNELHSDLKTGMNSAWQQFALGYPHRDNGAQYFFVDLDNHGSPHVNIGNRTRFIRQYFKHVRSGARRIAALSDNPFFDPLAFRNTHGSFVVVIKAGRAGEINVRGLPEGTYNFNYTTLTEFDVNLTTVTIVDGQNLSARMPASGVLTIYSSTVQKQVQKSSIVSHH